MKTLLARALRKAALGLSPSSNQIEIIDPYIRFLCYANAGMLNIGNLYLMEYALCHLPNDAPILEIGSFCGLSANVLTHLKQKHLIANRLITCDAWILEEMQRGEKTVANSELLFADYASFVRESYLRSTNIFSRGDLPFTIQATSDVLFAQWRANQSVHDIRGREIALGGPLSFCYIDGNHTYDAAKRDFLNCDEFLATGGFLLFDDSSVGEFGVARLVSEILKMGRFELVGKNPNHLFRKL